jgi:hypothetical protein
MAKIVHRNMDVMKSKVETMCLFRDMTNPSKPPYMKILFLVIFHLSNYNVYYNMFEEFSDDELSNEKIIEFSNYKNPSKETISNASKEEYSIINLALMLSYEKKLKNLIENVKNELHDNIEISKNVLKVHISEVNDESVVNKQELDVPLDTKFIPDTEDSTGTNLHYDYL